MNIKQSVSYYNYVYIRNYKDRQTNAVKKVCGGIEVNKENIFWLWKRT